MIMDNKLVFSDAQAITATAASANIIDCGVANANLGEGSPLIIRLMVEETFLAAGAATLIISLQHGASDPPSTSLLLVASIAKEALVKGAYIPEIKIPDEHLRFLRLYYEVGTGPFTAGKITAFIDI